MKSTRNRVTDPQEIRRILDAYMREPEKQRAPFLFEIFSREYRPGGIGYVGYRPIAACQNDNGRFYTISSSESDYTRFEGCLKLSQIEYIEELS